MSDLPTDPNTRTGNREKRNVAASSVLAAIALTSMKLVVGLITGSLGILSEAAHSALDLAAAAMTWFAVRVSDKPADETHTYGHGKIENLSALFETVLLLATCVWIIYEAVQRLFYKPVDIEANVWAFAVMGTSIVIDVSRSRALYRVARKYHSQALEADALHFSTDVWSSSVVIIGLALVRLADIFRQPWLVKADAIAALGVAGIVVYVSLQLGKRTVAALLDAAPSGLRDQVVRAVRVPGVLEVKQARVRQSGPEMFADVTLAVSPEASTERAHSIASEAEAEIRRLVPGADVIVHVEPSDHASESLVGSVRMIAARQGLGAHAIRLHDVPGHRSLELHLEVPEHLSVDEAHAQATAFERAVGEAIPEIDQVTTHIEPAGDSSALQASAPAEVTRMRSLVEGIVRDQGLECEIHQLEVHRVRGELSVSFHCALKGEHTVGHAHDLTVRVEQALRARLPRLGRVVIHVEPQASEAT
jgi:cation diffusion facilitator family transporter